MIDRKKIADALREIASFYAPDEDCTNAIYDAQIAIADELDPPAKPLLADARVGDLCRLRNGGYTQIESVKGRSGKTWYDRTDGYTSYPDGRLFKGENNEPDIIHTEPLAEVGTAEWAWQMLMLQKPVSHPAEGEFQDTYYTKEGFVRCMAKTGWQLYEPKPEPEFKVGDWVEFKGKQYRISAIGGKGLFDDDNLIMFEGVIWCVSEKAELRKLDPSEVIVKIGCLKGTVAHSSSSHFCLCAEDNWTMIAFDMLDTPTRELVESLLKAQEVRND